MRLNSSSDSSEEQQPAGSDFLDVIGVRTGSTPLKDEEGKPRRRKRTLKGCLPITLVVPVTSAVLVFVLVGACIVPMTMQWNSSLTSVSDAARSNLLEELELYKRSLVFQAVSNVSSFMNQPPLVARLVEGGLPDSAYTDSAPLMEHYSVFQQLFRPINVEWVSFSNLMVAFQNAYGDHTYSEGYRSGWYSIYDSDVSNNVLVRYYINGTASNITKDSFPYNLTVRSWWITGLQADGGHWTDVYKSIGPEGYIIAYTKRVLAISVPAVIQISITLAYLKDYFLSMSLSPTGSAYLSDRTLQLIAASPGLTVQYTNGSVVKTLTSPNETVSVTTAAWLNFTNGEYAEAHFVVDLPSGKCYADIVPVTADGGLVLWLTLVTPEQDFLSNITKQQDKAINDAQVSLWSVLGVEVFIGLSAICLSISLAVILASALRKVTSKLQAVSDGSFSSKNQVSKALKTSAIREIDQLNAEVCTMQGTLESFSQYVPTQVVRYLCKNRLRPVVGFRPMKCVVMFLDLVDFTKKMDEYGPQIIIEVISTMFEAFSNIITQNSGTIDKYIGDAIMALWGCPEPLADPEMQACIAVDEILEEVSKLNVIFTKKFNLLMQVRIGVHFGEVRAGNVGSSQRLNYTVLGNTVNLASRIEPLNKELGTSVLVTDSIRDACSKLFSFRALGYIQVRGFKDPVLVHEFLGSSAKVNSKTMVMLEQYSAIDAALCNKSERQNDAAIANLFEEFLVNNPKDKTVTRALELLLKSSAKNM
ncbi:adenylate cyclase [Pelomyxa schiedti]|nr:adenylate cyclase [Pelomyxa schiedti]